MRWSWPLLASLAVIGLVGCGTPPAPAPTTPTEPTTRELSVAPPTTRQSVLNSIDMRFVKIPAGKFMMGSPESEKDRQPNETMHEVAITQPFYLGVFPVTQEEYKKVALTNPSWFNTVLGENTLRFPVEHVTWLEAQEFCQKLSGLPDEKRAGRSYRLPTEAEWEYACRAGTTAPFHFGTACNGKQANCNGALPCGTDEKGPFLQRTCTVGSYAPNAFGLYDMHGNVWQWCSDWYGDYPSAAATDPQGPETGNSRVMRGGAWSSAAKDCRAAARPRPVPGFKNDGIGFRVVLEP